MLILIKIKSIGIITGKLRTLIIIELFFTWYPIAETRVKQFEIDKEPKSRRVTKKIGDWIIFPMKKLKKMKEKIDTKNKKIKL